MLLYNKGKNRRSCLRYDFRAPIVFTLPDDAGRTFEGVVTNVSISGLCLSLGTPLPVGQEICIEGNYRPLAAERAIVRWLSKAEDNFSSRYRAGLLFQNGSSQG
jgi:hypothetical protein